MKEGGVDVDSLFAKIEESIIKVLIAVEPHMLDSLNKCADHISNCFELYGFDVILDNTFRPWVLECNVCPSLSSSSGFDKQIKNQLLSDTLNLVGFFPYDKGKFKQAQKRNLYSATPVEEKLMNISRGIKELADLKYENCIERLTPLDWEILFQSYEEMYRKGDFERIFPPASISQIDYYAKFFQLPRRNNIILW